MFDLQRIKSEHIRILFVVDNKRTLKCLSGLGTPRSDSFGKERIDIPGLGLRYKMEREEVKMNIYVRIG
jgi:hypothetical protein